MIHYHGTPVGGPSVDVYRFLKGRHALVSFADQKDIGVVAEVCQSFCLDNGAYAFWRRGAQVDPREYRSWVLEWSKHPGFDWALIPDIIDGNEEDNDANIEDWRGAGLVAYGVPVWHLHESLDRLARLCHEWPRVALGSSGTWSTPGSKSWWVRMSVAMDAICDRHGRPKAKLHGLRMLSPEIIARLPLSSADSTNASRNKILLGRFGMYVPPNPSQRASVIADRVEAQNSPAVWVPE